MLPPNGFAAAQKYGHLETLRSLATKTQTEGEEGGIGICIGERASSLMLHLAAEYGRECLSLSRIEGGGGGGADEDTIGNIYGGKAEYLHFSGKREWISHVQFFFQVFLSFG